MGRLATVDGNRRRLLRCFAGGAPRLWRDSSGGAAHILRRHLLRALRNHDTRTGVRSAWAKLLQIPRPYLYAGIIFFASMGAYAVNAQPLDLLLFLVLGLLGSAMRRFGLPVLPLIIGVILGPIAERQPRMSPMPGSRRFQPV